MQKSAPIGFVRQISILVNKTITLKNKTAQLLQNRKAMPSVETVTDLFSYAKSTIIAYHSVLI